MSDFPQTSPGDIEPRTLVTPGMFKVAERAIASEEIATNRKRLTTAYAIAMVLLPLFAVTDLARALVAPDEIELMAALGFRALATVVIGAVFLRLRTAKRLEEPELDLWVNFMAPFLVVVVALLSLCISGVDSPYTDAVNLVVTGYAFVPRRWTKVVLSAVLSVVAFPSTFLIAALFSERARMEVMEPRFAMDLAIETAILAATIVVLASAAHMLWALRREVFAARSIGRYRVKARLGRGGMGEVWAAFDETLQREVALKVLRVDSPDPVALARFEREVRATIELTHPNTVRVLDVGVTDDGLSYYAMELLEGETLATLMRRERILAPARAVHFALQAARALAEAHARGIIHRDVKPENLFVTRIGDESDHLKVLDFGIARLERSEAEGASALTRTGMVAGTPHYLAPEVIEGADANAAADVYALGVALYEMLTGRSPYGTAEGPSLLFAHVSTSPPPPSAHVRVPPELEEIVMRCLEKRPENRYPSGRELALALAGLEVSDEFRVAPRSRDEASQEITREPKGALTRVATPRAALRPD